MSTKTGSKITLTVARGRVLGLKVYRGFAPLSDLARISRPDIYDQVKNPRGTQRDLSKKHAREAYEYVRSNPCAFYPEIVLNARRPTGLKYRPVHPDDKDVGYLQIDVDRIRRSKATIVSRVDGNHRLHYADGHDPAMPPLNQQVGFCLIYALEASDADRELLLFRDINANQKGMNTSHLDSIAVRTMSDLKIRDPLLYIAERLMDDPDSPFHGLVYRGGVRPPGFRIPLRTLKTSVEYLKSRSKKLDLFGDVDVQAILIKNFWSATKLWLPLAWRQPKSYIALRATGFWALAFIGSEVVDRAVASGKVEPDNMRKILESGQTWDWSNSGDFRGYGGRAGALEIANRVIAELEAEGRSVKDLEEQILGGASRTTGSSARPSRQGRRPGRAKAQR
jgi:DGQHR domain-containing protein